MGEVYRAHDARLGREVALKILPESVAHQPDRLARFEREARVLASLNHPNIAQIYGVEESGGVQALVMELVGGEDLDQRLRRGALTVGEAVAISGQVAAALEAAHEAGVVHRDLKPANVRVRTDGTVKVLDFGIAKAGGAVSGKISPSSVAPEDTPTIVTPAMTQAGAILGTAAYMAPEQARGQAVDRRADIWSFGALLFEMLAGTPLFSGATASDVIASILRQEIDFARLPSGTPESIRRLLARCLERDVNQRLQAIGEARAALSAVPRATAARGSRRPAARIALAGAIVVLAAAGLVGWLATKRPAGARSETTGAASHDRSLAVLPFVNSSGNPADEYVADGMTDELTAALAKVPRLRVAARSSAFTFKGRKIEAREAAAQLGVETILEGTVRRFGQRLRVTASLVSAADGLQLWSRSFESDGSDPFAVQDDVTHGVVSGLSLQLAGDALQASQAGRTRDSEAHDLYLRGLASANPASEADLLRAIDFYQQALKRDPDFALPYVGIGWVHIFLADAYTAPKEACVKARVAAEAALARDALLADAHAILAYSTMVTDWSFPPTIEAEVRRALELDPNSATTRTFLALYRGFQGRPDEALAEVARAERQDPLSPVPPFVRQWINFVAGRWQDVIEAQRRTEAIDPAFVYIESWAGGAQRELGDYEAALREYEKAEKLLGGAPQCGLALTYLRLGREQDARDMMRRIDEHAARHYMSPGMRAVVHAALGDIDGGVALLEEALDRNDVYLLAARPLAELAALEADPRGRRVMERVEAVGKVR